MIKDKTTPQLRKKFLDEIKKTKELGKESGFHLCIEVDGKLSAENTCTGDECHINFQQSDISCPRKKVQGSFHTHPYLADVRKRFNVEFKGASDELLSASIEAFLKETGLTPTIPSHADAIDAILGKCAKKTEGTTCVGTDLDMNKVECWTINKMDDGDCIRALVEMITPKEEGHQTLPHDWVEPLFDKEMIELKSTKKNNTRKI